MKSSIKKREIGQDDSSSMSSKIDVSLTDRTKAQIIGAKATLDTSYYVAVGVKRYELDGVQELEEKFNNVSTEYNKLHDEYAKIHETAGKYREELKNMLSILKDLIPAAESSGKKLLLIEQIINADQYENAVAVVTGAMEQLNVEDPTEQFINNVANSNRAE